MSEKIIIIESPNKTQKIKSYSACPTYATIGHFKTLAKDFIKDYNTYEAEFEFANAEKEKQMNYIFSQCKNKEVIIATDPDREGYAIGFLFYLVIKNIAKSIKRAEFFEITQSGIEKGLAKAQPFEKTNFKDFEAFKARAVGDKLVGFLLSPKYIRALNDKNTSIGRVQTPALNLIVLKEEEIQNFNKLKDEDKLSYKLNAVIKVDEKEFKITSKNVYQSKQDLQDFISFIQDNKKALLEEISTKESKKSPPKPFRTSQLQEKANSRFGFSSEETMLLAQQLFEQGLITYTRTDSNALSEEFLNEVAKNYQNETWYERREYKAGKQSQAEAHEAIRITHLHKYEEIENVVKEAFKGSKGASANHIKLYTLIFENSLCSQAKDSINEVKEYLFKIKAVPFSVSTSKCIYEGFKGIFTSQNSQNQDDDEDENENNESTSKLDLSFLEKAKEYEIAKFEELAIKKQAPTRYKESNFISLLEKEGIGRPSTYASFLPTLLKRKFIELEKKGKNSFIKPTAKGQSLIKLLKDNNDEWVSQSEFTRLMEEVLENISKGNTTYKDFIKTLHEKMNFAKVNEESANKAPSEKQIALIQKLCSEQNIAMPDESILSSAKLACKFIDETMKSAPPKPPSQKQIALAEKLSNEENLQLPKNYKEDMKICADFIDKAFKSKDKK